MTTTVAPPEPNKTQLVPLATQALQVALSVTTKGPTDPITQAQIAALTNTAIDLGEQAASAAGGPLAGLAADALLPQLAGQFVPALVELLEQAEMKLGDEWTRATTWLAKTI